MNLETDQEFHHRVYKYVLFALQVFWPLKEAEFLFQF